MADGAYLEGSEQRTGRERSRMGMPARIPPNHWQVGSTCGVSGPRREVTQGLGSDGLWVQDRMGLCYRPWPGAVSLSAGVVSLEGDGIYRL